MVDMPVDSPLLELEPRVVWSFFDRLRRIPRPPGGEDRVVAWITEWAAAHGFDQRSDAAGNLLVAVPAKSGHEAAPTVVLQAHLDMVGEREPGSEHDFDRDPIEVAVADGWVSARSTTLGADNGLGVALAMAMAEGEDIVHGPLELLFTLEEEVGLVGAGRLDPNLVGGRLLINLDSEDDDAVYIGCAGAGGVEARLPLARGDAKPAAELWQLRIGGLRGGHSGMEIIENRGNAPQLLARALIHLLDRGMDFGVISFHGGSKANAIPRDAAADLALAPAGVAHCRQLLEELGSVLRDELGEADPGLELELVPLAPSASPAPLTSEARNRLLALLLAVPHGVRAMSLEMPGLVETSVNLAIVELPADQGESEARLLISCRSSVNGALAATRRGLRALVELAGGRARELGGYPGWRPRPSSSLARLTAATYESLFQTAPELRAVHAGLECGILAEKLAGLDAVSIGPAIRGAHSPHERASVASVVKVHRWLTALLVSLAGS